MTLNRKSEMHTPLLFEHKSNSNSAAERQIESLRKFIEGDAVTHINNKRTTTFITFLFFKSYEDVITNDIEKISKQLKAILKTIGINPQKALSNPDKLTAEHQHILTTLKELIESYSTQFEGKRFTQPKLEKQWKVLKNIYNTALEPLKTNFKSNDL